MNNSKKKFHPGLTLIEVVIAAAILFIIVTGALSYQYHSAVHNRKAQSYLTATRIAQLLTEDWKNNGGAPNYDPTILNLGFLTSKMPEADYYSFVDNLYMFIILNSTDVLVDPDAGVTLRRIDVKVVWSKNYRFEAPKEDDPYVFMSTYVRNDAAGG